MNAARILLIVTVAGTLLAGCGGETIQFTYQRQALYDIPQTVKRVAVAEFGGQTIQDRQWGDIASDRLVSALDSYNRQFHRYELVDRKRLKAIMDERDLQIMIADSGSAAKMGKLANADAMIYGQVHTVKRDEWIDKPSFSLSSRRPTTKRQLRRYCMAAVTFTMDDIASSRTLAAVSVTREYDSDKSKAGSGSAAFTKALGMSSSADPADQVLHGLISECVDEFLAKVSPHTVTVKVKLEGGRSSYVKTANKLAKAHEWDEALDLYRRAIAENPDDHGAIFNAGVAYEAKGDLAEAAAHYDRAFRLKPNDKYIEGRTRVRRLIGG